MRPWRTILLTGTVMLGLMGLAGTAASLPPSESQPGVVVGGEGIDPLQTLRTDIEMMLQDKSLAGVQLGLSVTRCRSGEVIFDRDGHVGMNPASNLKILTSIAALELLGPAFSFRTRFMSSGEIKDGTLQGDLYLRGGGNPVWPYEDVWKAIKDLQALGLTHIDGNLIADDTYFDEDRRIPGWIADDDDDSRAFSAQLGALSVNFNTVALLIRPAEMVGQPARAGFETPSRYVVLDNQVTTSSKGGDTLQVVAVEDGPPVKLKASGTIGVNSPAKRLYRALPDPTGYALSLVGEMMQKEGISMAGTRRRGPSPKDARTLHTVYSEPLSILLTYMNKISSNFIAEQVLKTLGAEKKGEPGSSSGGLAAIKEWLMEKGLWDPSIRMVNASGLSTENRISTAQMTRILNYVYEHGRYRWEFIGSLPVAGVDGTLRTRMKGEDAQGVLRAKTGSINGVYAMSGYVLPESGEPLAFSIIANTLPRSRQEEVRKVMERVLNKLVSWSRGDSPQTPTTMPAQ